MSLARMQRGWTNWRIAPAAMCGFALVVGALMTAHAQAQVATVEVKTVGGKQLQGELTEIREGRLTLETSSGAVELPLDQVMFIASKEKPLAKAAGETIVTLTDGSVLLGNFYSSDGKVGKLAMRGASDTDVQLVELPVSAVASVKLRWWSAELDAKWRKLNEKPTAADLLVVRRKETLDLIEGVLGKLDAERVEFTVDGRTLGVNREKVQGIFYAHRDEAPRPGAKLRAAGGMLLEVKNLTLADNKLVVTTGAGATVRVPLAELERLDFSAGKLTYLSSLEPLSVEWKPYFDALGNSPALSSYFQPRIDQNRFKGELMVGGKSYSKGLSLVGATTVVYRLPAEAKQFRAVVGVADSAAADGVKTARGAARLIIRADDRQVFSGLIADNAPPQDIDVDLAGAKRLTIAVEYGDGVDMGTELVLADARIMK